MMKNESAKFYVTNQELTSNGQENDEAGIGITKVLGQVVVYDLDFIYDEPIHGIGQEATAIDRDAWAVNFDSVAEAVKSLEKIQWDMKQFTGWLQQNEAPNLIVVVDIDEE